MSFHVGSVRPRCGICEKGANGNGSFYSAKQIRMLLMGRCVGPARCAGPDLLFSVCNVTWRELILAA